MAAVRDKKFEALHKAIAAHVRASKKDDSPRKALDTMIRLQFNLLGCQPFSFFTLADESYYTDFYEPDRLAEIETARQMVSAYVQLVIDSQPFEDVLSELVMTFGASQAKQLGQFFTPPGLAKAVVAFEPQLKPNPETGRITTGDPTGCGAGSLLMAQLQKINRITPEYMQLVDVYGVDLDPMMCRYTAVQVATSCFAHKIPIGDFTIWNANIITDWDVPKVPMFKMRLPELVREIA